MPRVKTQHQSRGSTCNPYGQGYLPLQDDQIHYAGQPVVLVVANTLDQAACAGTLVKVEYDVKPPVVFNAETAKRAFDPPQFLWPVSSSVGDPAKAVVDGAVKIESVYYHRRSTPQSDGTARDDGDLGFERLR